MPPPKTVPCKHDQATWLTAVTKLDASIRDVLTQTGSLQQLTKEGLQELDAERRSFAQETRDQREEERMDRKRRLQEVDLEVQKRKRDAAVEFLAGTGEEPIKTERRVEMEAAIERLRADNTEAVDNAVASVQKSLTAAHTAESDKKDLEHKAKMATVEEKNNSLATQLKVQEQVVAGLREDIQRTQAMVTSVAQASQQVVAAPFKATA